MRRGRAAEPVRRSGPGSLGVQSDDLRAAAPRRRLWSDGHISLNPADLTLVSAGEHGCRTIRTWSYDCGAADPLRRPRGPFRRADGAGESDIRARLRDPRQPRANAASSTSSCSSRVAAQCCASRTCAPDATIAPATSGTVTSHCPGDIRFGDIRPDQDADPAERGIKDAWRLARADAPAFARVFVGPQCRLDGAVAARCEERG